ncbi:MAG: protein-L-isoaspartate(D-aspartate) O-methyltransferase [Myxococcota bacterium]
MRGMTRARTMAVVLLTAAVGVLLIGLGPDAGFAPAGGSRLHAQDSDDRAVERREMVKSQIESRGVTNPRVLEAMRSVPRHRFVPPAQQAFAYADRPLPIGHQQTISQPYIVALMSALADVGPGDRVLEVGTGSGYQAAVLAQMGADVFSIEIVAPLGARAKSTLRALGYGARIRLRTGDGYAGWPEKAPFAAIVVTAAPPSIPEPLKAQLAVGGRLVIPVGDRRQRLLVVTRTPTGFEERMVIPVRFVPMTGKAQEL